MLVVIYFYIFTAVAACVVEVSLFNLLANKACFGLCFFPGSPPGWHQLDSQVELTQLQVEKLSGRPLQILQDPPRKTNKQNRKNSLSQQLDSITLHLWCNDSPRGQIHQSLTKHCYIIFDAAAFWAWCQHEDACC